MPAQKRTDDQPRLWKDFINLERMRKLAEVVYSIEPSFDRKLFIRQLEIERLESRELKDRMALAARILKDRLPSDWNRVCDVLEAVAPRFGGWENAILTSCIEQFGLDKPKRSLRALKLLTCHGTAESAIRPYILQDPKGVLPILNEWAEDSNEHVRRLVAEGLRPRGVWIMHLGFLKEDPTPALAIIRKLNADNAKYVQRAVANNLNDISKDHPTVAVATARAWLKNGRTETRWIVEHALRSLIKKGDKGALALLGAKHTVRVHVSRFCVSPARVKRGGTVQIETAIKLSGRTDEKIVIDFAVEYQTASGKPSRKVYKWSTRDLKPGVPLKLARKLSLVDRSTRKHHPGRHTITLLVNGRTASQTKFHITA